MTAPDFRGAGSTSVIVTAFGPDTRLADVVVSALRQADHIVVVDNTPLGVRGAESLLKPSERVRILRTGRNLGLAGALNRGLAESDPDASTFLLLDQDSVLPDDLVARLATRLAEDPRIAIAAPAPWDTTENRYLDPRTSSRAQVADLPVVITSGMLVRRAAFDEAGPFREDFFVDCVDQDFCLRVRRAGWRVVQDRSTLLPHSLGETTWHGWGPLKLRATHHPTWRLYWVARNGVVLAREHARREPLWAATTVALLGYWALTVLLFEPPRRDRLAHLARGARDGWRGRTDPSYLPADAR